MIVAVLTLLYIVLMAYGSYKDIKTHTIEFWLSGILYALALVIALLNHMSILKVLVYSSWLFIILTVTELCYQHFCNKEHDENKIGIGTGDIVLAPALTLMTAENGIIAITVALFLALVYLATTRKKNVALMPFFFIGVLIFIVRVI